MSIIQKSLKRRITRGEVKTQNAMMDVEEQLVVKISQEAPNRMLCCYTLNAVFFLSAMLQALAKVS